MLGFQLVPALEAYWTEYDERSTVVVPMFLISMKSFWNVAAGGGGNAGPPAATFQNDFIEIKNIGTTTVDLSSYSVQYASSTGTSWNPSNLGGLLPAGSTYVVKEAGGATGAPLTEFDTTDDTNLSGTNGKVALVSSQTALTCGADCDSAAGVVDFVGYGTANDFEGTAAPAATNAASVTRNSTGTDTDVNGTDFSQANPPTPSACGAACIPPSTQATIAEIQGAGHISPLNGDAVTDVAGVITARGPRGYYLQDPAGPDAEGYVDGASSGVYVFTSSAPAANLVPGTAVEVDATVQEFRPGSTGLTITELTSPTTTVLATGQPIPAPTLVGGTGLPVPSTVIDNDAAPGTQVNVETGGEFEPSEDGIDFWESLEGMSIQIDDARVVGPTNVTFGETPIVPAGSGTETERGGIVLLQDDPNPERIVLDNGLGTVVPKANTGDTYAGPTVGVVDYDFNNFHLMATARPTRVSGGITREVATASQHNELSVATFNVENLDPSDPQSKFNDLADIIVDNLKSPDLLALEEVQDNNGAVDTGETAADLTLQQLVDAISASGGPSYTWEQIDPRNDQEGGEPGGNIRVAFLIQEGTPLSFVERDRGTSDEDTDVVDGATGPELTHSPGRVEPDNAAWAATRVPLAGEFTFGGQKVFVVANHWSSKGGDESLFGPKQPPFQGSEAKRVQQAQVVNNFVDEIYAKDADANVVVLGDLNDFEYSDSVTTLTDDGDALLDLPSTLPDDERYTYVFDGNSQVLDHIAISNGAASQGFDYDVVHVNAEFNDQASDHDPQVVDLQLGLPVTNATASASPGQVVFGQSSTVSGVLSDVTSGAPLPGATVHLQSRPSAAADWTETGATTTTNGNGRFAFAVSPSRNTQYRVVFDGDASHDSTRSNAVTVNVAPRISVSVSDNTVKKGTRVTFFGVVSPNHSGDKVALQLKVNGAWVTQSQATLDEDSAYQARWTPQKKGTFTLRVLKAADGDHVQGVSGTVEIVVR